MNSANDVNQDFVASDSVKYAGFWIRVGAFLIDVLVLLIPLTILSSLLSSLYSPATAGDYSIHETLESILTTIVWFIYTTTLHSSQWQATVGKKLLNLKVVDLEGNRITFARASGRYFAEFLSAVLLFIGYLMIAWTPKKQSLHDKIASTYVIKSNE